MKVRFTSGAERDFLSAIEHIRRENPSAARTFLNRAQTSLRRLQDFPESGRHIPECPKLPYREAIVAPYRFFYRVKDGIDWIVSVWYDAQIPSEPDELDRYT